MHQIEKLSVPDGGSIFYQDPWLVQIEAHLPYLRTAPGTKIVDVPADLANRYRTDPVGLFDYYKYPRYMHHVILRVNDWNILTEIPSLRRFLLPSTSDIESIRLKLSSTYNRSFL